MRNCCKSCCGSLTTLRNTTDKAPTWVASTVPRFLHGQRATAEALAALRQVASSRTYPARIVTQVAALQQFYVAEPYHQNYVAQHLDQAYIILNDLPKLEALRRQFPDLYR